MGLRDALNRGKDLDGRRLRKERPGERDTGQGPGGDHGGWGGSD